VRQLPNIGEKLGELFVAGFQRFDMWCALWHCLSSEFRLREQLALRASMRCFDWNRIASNRLSVVIRRLANKYRRSIDGVLRHYE
jgi:hypothetical protein